MLKQESMSSLYVCIVLLIQGLHILGVSGQQQVSSSYYQSSSSVGDGSRCEQVCGTLRCVVDTVRQAGVSCVASKGKVWQQVQATDQQIAVTASPVRSCEDVSETGEYELMLGPGAASTSVYCLVDGTGKWTVIQRRQDGSVDFYRDWQAYKQGFGNVTGEHWLGNDVIHQLTVDSGLTTLRIDMENGNHVTYTVHYGTFSVADEAEDYKLSVGGFVGSSPPGDSLISRHNGCAFSTHDRDNDRSSSKSCAQRYLGAWWYASCHHSNLNGVYGSTAHGKGINWYTWTGYTLSLKSVIMMIKKP